MTGDLVCKTLKTQALFAMALFAMVLMWGCQDLSLETITPRDLLVRLSLDTEYWYSSLKNGSSMRALRRLCL